MKAYISKSLTGLIDLILPPQSLLTGDLLDGKIEGDLWGNITFLDEPCCYACGLPFEYDVGSESLCGDCSTKHPAYNRARAAFIYDDNSRKLVLSFKHGGRTEGLYMFTQHMRRAGRSFWTDADYIIPVPLHSSRLIKRRFNQSALLAKSIAKHVGVEFAADILFRTRATESQGGKSPKGRARNVRGAFAVKEQQQIKDKHIVLIDDVMTTGATLQSCARTLKRAGASHIDVVTLTRTVREQSINHA